MRRWRGAVTWFLLISGLLYAAAATLVHAKPGVVRTREGQTYDGDVDEKDPDNVVVTVRGIKTTIARTRIASIDYGANFQKEFADRMSKLAPNDVDGRLALAREAFNQKQYALARQAAESARMIDPNNADAISMLETIQSQMRLERAKQATETARAGATTQPAAATRPAGSEMVLAPADINIIRQAELRPDDSGVRIRFERDVKKRFVTREGMPPAEFNSMTINQQVDAILQKGTPEMKHDVQILSDPPALFQYRRQIQPFLVANCATSGCHGGGTSKFSLVVPADSDAATYTNFYILQQYTKSLRVSTGGGNVFGKGDLKVIDRQQPERSLLLQYALPATVGEYHHPDITNYKPALRSMNDPKHRQMVDWIGKSLKPVDPDYGINFPVPGSASTQPAVTAASAPATQALEPEQPPRATTRRGGPGGGGVRPPATRPALRPPSLLQPSPPVRAR